jgi:hypothetical protein
MQKFLDPIANGGAPMLSDTVLSPIFRDIYSALEATLNNISAETQGVILKGCVITPNAGNFDCTSGIVYLDGQFMAFAGFTNQPATIYICADAPVNTAKTFFDGVSRNLIVTQSAKHQGSAPGGGQYISVSSTTPRALTNYVAPQLQGSGLVYAANLLNVNVDGTSIVIASDTVKLPNGYIAVQSPDAIQIYTKVVSIGDWDMDASNTINVTPGIATPSKIRSVEVIILSDLSGSDYSVHKLDGYDSTANNGTVNGGVSVASSTTVGSLVLWRKPSGEFDNTTFNATSYNRGFVIITYQA